MNTRYKLIRDKETKEHAAEDLHTLNEDAFYSSLKHQLIDAAYQVQDSSDKESLILALAELQEVMDYLKGFHQINQMDINTLQALLSLRKGRYELKQAVKR